MTKKKRILIALYYYEPYISGVSVYAKTLAEKLAKRGHRVTVLTSRYDKNLPKRELINGVYVVRSKVIFKKSKGVIMPGFWLRALQLSWDNDIFNPHLPMPDTGLSSIFIPKRKIVTTYQCDIRLSKGIFDSLIVKLSFALMHLQLWRSRAVITLSNDYFSHSRMKSYLHKSHPIYPPIDHENFKPVKYYKLQKKLKINDNTVLIGYFGRVVYEKGINYLLEAIPLLNKHVKNFKIIIGGEYEKIAGGSIKDELDKYINLYPEQIVFTGYLDDEERRQFYSMLDVMVLPSIDPLEAFGIVQVESMLCGTPVVASNLPGVREVVNSTGYGCIAKPMDPSDISKQIINILTLPDKYKPSRKKVVSMFNIQQTLDSYEELF